MTLEPLLDFAVSIATGAGKIALAGFRSQTAARRKADGTVVTETDRAAERFLREGIAAAFPGDEIIGEELGTLGGSSGRRWIVDPIDGTFSFVHGVPLFGVLVGLEIEEVVSLGVAHFPALDETIAAARGSGCRLNGALVHASRVDRLDAALVVTNDPMEAMPLVQAAASYRGWGDCYGYLLVATGRADIALDPVVKVWDCAALAPIVEEAGGTFTDWHGVRTIRGGSAVATNGFLFESAIEKLKGRSA